MGASCTSSETRPGAQDDEQVRVEIEDTAFTEAARAADTVKADGSSQQESITVHETLAPTLEKRIDATRGQEEEARTPASGEVKGEACADNPKLLANVEGVAARELEAPATKTPIKAGAKAKAKSKAAAEAHRKKLEKSAKELEKMMNEMKAESQAGKNRLGITQTFAAPVVMGDEYMMSQKGHGTCSKPVQKDLRWGCDFELADEICCFNRKAAEDKDYLKNTSFLEEMRKAGEGPVTFHDSNSGRVLFTAPKNRSMKDFLDESIHHGWPSFRDDEVNWLNVRVLADGGECVSVHGTHLGHCFKDALGKSPHRYCINLVSVAGKPAAATSESIIVKGLK